MIKYIKNSLILFLLTLFSVVLFACDDDSNNSNSTKFTSITYQGIKSVDDINVYHSEVRKNGKNNDDPVENGVVNCPYYTLKINGIDVPVYSTRCAESVHSFVWIDVDKNETSIELNVELTLKKSHKDVVVLPEKSGVLANLEGNVVTATINDLGSFSFAFDKKVEEALTIYVAKEEQLNAPSSYSKIEFSPETYSSSDTSFSEEETVYYFKKGVYEISSISIPSNSVLFFESGSYINVVPESEKDNLSALRSTNTENIKICGRAVFDFSSCQGGNSKIKGVYNFHNVSDIKLSGNIVINSNNWSICFTDCDNVLVDRNMCLGYRTYSDGIMLSDCQDSIVRNNFVRTGDDAIEAKSTGTESTENLVYENNAVWTDKARAYGCIYECNNSVKNVVFKNNSVGFALATWAEFLGCCTINMGDRRTTTWQDVHFENIEIYISYHALINITLSDAVNSGIGGGKAKDIYFENISAYRAYGRALYVYVENGSSLGKIYLDNINFNGETLESNDLKTSDFVSIIHYSPSWSITSNIQVNSLSGQE